MRVINPSVELLEVNPSIATVKLTCDQIVANAFKSGRFRCTINEEPWGDEFVLCKPLKFSSSVLGTWSMCDWYKADLPLKEDWWLYILLVTDHIHMLFCERSKGWLEDNQESLSLAFASTITITASTIEWRYIIQTFSRPEVHPHIRSITSQILELLHRSLPATFDTTYQQYGFINEHRNRGKQDE